MGTSYCIGMPIPLGSSGSRQFGRLGGIFKIVQYPGVQGFIYMVRNGKFTEIASPQMSKWTMKDCPFHLDEQDQELQHHQQLHLHRIKYSVLDVVDHMVGLIYQNMFANQNNMYCNLYISMFECNDFK